MSGLKSLQNRLCCVFTFAHADSETMLLVRSAFRWKSPGSNLCVRVCLPFVQEGQVLECSLINSIRVGAVPKVRTPAQRHFPSFVCLHIVPACGARLGSSAETNESRRTCCIAHSFSQPHLLRQYSVINHTDQADPDLKPFTATWPPNLHQQHKRSDPSRIY